MGNIYELIEEEGKKWKLSESGILKIKDFYKILGEWNKRINLVSRTGFDSHFLSLLQISLWYSNFIAPFHNFIDVGSGGGFPSFIFKIFNPDSEGILIEPSLRKGSYLSSASERLGFKNQFEILRMDFKSAIHFLKKRKIKIDYITTMGFKKKEQLIKEIEITRKGVSFITGEMEIERLREIKPLKKMKWLIKPIPERDFIKGVLIKIN